MLQKALAEQPHDDSNTGASYALAVEPDPSQAKALQRMLDARIGGRLRVAASIDEAFAALVERIPDLILMSPLLAPNDEEQIVARLGAMGIDASHVRLLSIPRFGDGSAPAEKKRRFGWQSQKGPSAVGGGCDPVAFADDVAEYLSHASTLRQQSQTTIDDQSSQEQDDEDTLAGLRMEHIEQLLERLDADAPRADLPPQTDGDPAPIPEPEPMTTSATPDTIPGTTRHSGEARLPRFLTLDEKVPLPLRALLEEADGCLKMSFLVGAGACAGRTLDLLLAEQGLAESDRAEQILQLGKKHPAVAESFLRGLSLVTNNPSGAWDEARATLAIAILKAITYEIYVLGPERKERAAYVLELLERYRSVAKG
jgi:hypothetical protein